mmetsp:Transcript_10933/g.20830  ORF Transcript_10933/g.20830 Transcript_10933/m.20830 type:complete len:204 (+) Transcript_10933:205-816(+)
MQFECRKFMLAVVFVIFMIVVDILPLVRIVQENGQGLIPDGFPHSHVNRIQPNFNLVHGMFGFGLVINSNAHNMCCVEHQGRGWEVMLFCCCDTGSHVTITIHHTRHQIAPIAIQRGRRPILSRIKATTITTMSIFPIGENPSTKQTVFFMSQRCQVFVFVSVVVVVTVLMLLGLLWLAMMMMMSLVNRFVLLLQKERGRWIW